MSKKRYSRTGLCFLWSQSLSGARPGYLVMEAVRALVMGAPSGKATGVRHITTNMSWRLLAPDIFAPQRVTG